MACRKTRNIPRPGADSSGNPHPDQTAANKAKGVDVMLIMEYKRQGLTASTYKVSLGNRTLHSRRLLEAVRLHRWKWNEQSISVAIAPHTEAACGCIFRKLVHYRLRSYACLQVLGSTRVMPSNGTELLRGVFSMEPEADLSSGTVYLETAHPGMTFDYQTPKFYLARDLSSKSVTPSMPNVTDTYSPCAIMPEHGYTVVYEVELPQGSNSSDNLNIFMCSPGGYDQVCPAFMGWHVLSCSSCSH